MLEAEEKVKRSRTPRRGRADEPARAALRLERRGDGRLWALFRGEAQPVKVCRCFPWSEPTLYVSLRDNEEEEIALVRELAELEPASREALELALAEAGFVMEIQEIFAIDEEIEIRNWKVGTCRGKRSFQTPRDEWPREVPGGGLIIRDVSGDLFYVPDPESLDAASLRLLWPFVD